jgi:sporulation protein YlmC with PRC-barrel domain/CBS domain-containing protein
MNIFKNFPDLSIHFSTLIGTKIYKEDQTFIGSTNDLFVNFEEAYPSTLAIQFKNKSQIGYVLWSDILDFNKKKIIISESGLISYNQNFPKLQESQIATSALARQFRGESVELPPLGKVLLDRQVVDTSGKKVIRVNDLELVKAGGKLKLTHALVGIRSLLRRIGLLPLFNFLVFKLNIPINSIKKESIINWKFIHALPTKNMQRSVQVSLTNDQIKKMHPADLADILEELDTNSRKLIFNELDTDHAAETLSEVHHGVQMSLIKDEPEEEVAEILSKMGPDEAADILGDVEEEKKERIIKSFEDEELEQEIKDLLEYEEDSAGGLMSSEVFQITPELNKKDILTIIKKEFNDIESVYDIFVVNEIGQLIGYCPLNKLLISDDEISIGNLMQKEDIKVVSPEDSWRDVASLMSKYNLINLAVTNTSSNELLGIISVDDVLPWLLNERS